jgi:hypothetical protein
MYKIHTLLHRQAVVPVLCPGYGCPLCQCRNKLWLKLSVRNNTQIKKLKLTLAILKKKNFELGF